MSSFVNILYQEFKTVVNKRQVASMVFNASLTTDRHVKFRQRFMSRTYNSSKVTASSINDFQH